MRDDRDANRRFFGLVVEVCAVFACMVGGGEINKFMSTLTIKCVTRTNIFSHLGCPFYSTSLVRVFSCSVRSHVHLLQHSFRFFCQIILVSHHHHTYALSEPLFLTHLLFLATDKYSLLHIHSPTVSLSLTGAIRTNTSDPQHTTSHGCKKRGTNRNTANNKSVVTDSRSTCKPA